MILVKPAEWQPSPGIQIAGTALKIVQSGKPTVVLAGPGAGKTEILAQRAMYLLSTGSCPAPRRILAISFKVDAARNLEVRVRERCEEIHSKRFESLTLHAFSKRILDQFREALAENLRPSHDYNVVLTNRDVWNEFRESLANKYPPQAHAIRAYSDEQLDKIAHGTVPQGEIGEDIPLLQIVNFEWWKNQIESEPSQLTFDMIMCLATHILLKHNNILKALHQTYSHVFLDEFQDVTNAQYKLVKTAFLGSEAVLTAVGDSNQAIMRWAGARADIFDRFVGDFGAQDYRLQFNFRSNSRIVQLINDLTATFDEDAIETECGRGDTPVPVDPVQVWVFDTRDIEAKFLAKFVREELDNGANLVAEDFVILARIRINDVENRIAESFKEQGLQVRNEARSVGGIAIQDLVKEHVFNFILATIKLAVNVRDGQPFQTCRDFIATVRGIDINSDNGHRESWDAVRVLVDELQEFIEERSPENITGAEVLRLVLTHIERDEIRRGFNEYRSGDRLETIISGFEAFFDECRKEQKSWEECVAVIEGKDQVRLMTIHKSKGLEYHTVIFVEFNDDAFWGNDDDVNVFFVALSRARERVYFSIALDSRGYSNIQGFLGNLKEAEVPIVKKE